ncbi:ABC transporter substrate-binding protein [Microbacterium sp. MYb62]|uniref:ABC transporter substrate-binding protein n=1 Tax=Microbacterium sp. MYb62 TaxID=1848690 RepID=UPI000CFC1895|nr:ABC transporter substrate-binding protein [Microbacterium sp. MYb62]PRB18600.1 ABC transporter substrate-binding protein [Microbacterium sp. MYb62]
MSASAPRAPHRVSALAVIAAGALALTACTPAADTPQTTSAAGEIVDGGSLRVGIHAEPGNLDPTFASTFTSVTIYNTMCELLYNVDADGVVYPQLAAAAPEFDETGTVVTVPLREGVLFQDGTPFDAAAVKATLERNLTAEGSQRTNELDALESVEVVDDHTVRMHLDEPVAQGVFDVMFTDRAGIMLSPTAFQDAAAFEQHPVCVGPFEFGTRVAQDSVTLLADEEYYDSAQVHLDEIIYKIIPDTSVRATNLLSGDIDVMEKADATSLAVLEPASDVVVEQFPSIGYYNLEFNVGNVGGAPGDAADIDSPVAADAALRQALALTIDRDAINAAVFSGAFEPACGFMAPSSPLASDTTLACPGPDIEKAKGLVAESGVETPIRVELMMNQQPEFRRMGEVIQQMAAEAGFEIVLDVQESTTTVDRGYGGDFQLYMNTWSGRIDPDANISLFAMSDSPRSMSKYSDPEVDRLLIDARSSSDQDARIDAYDEIQQILDEDMPFIYLIRPTNIVGMGESVTGVRFRPNGSVVVGNAGFLSE